MIKEILDKLHINLQLQTGRLEEYVYVMSSYNYKKLTKELRSISGTLIMFELKYKSHTVIPDTLMISDKIILIHWNDYNKKDFSDMLKADV